jgi:hypothetical protein
MIVRGVVDGIPTGARGAAFESNELRSEPIRTRKDNRARVKQRQYIPIKIALALVRRAVRDTVLTEKFSGEFAGIFVASYQRNAVPLQDVQNVRSPVRARTVPALRHTIYNNSLTLAVDDGQGKRIAAAVTRVNERRFGPRST